MSLWQEHEPDLTELGERAERAMRFSFLSDVSAEYDRHNPRRCACYLVATFLNHVDGERGAPCRCVACVKLRRQWTTTRPLHCRGRNHQ